MPHLSLASFVLMYFINITSTTFYAGIGIMSMICPSLT